MYRNSRYKNETVSRPYHIILRPYHIILIMGILRESPYCQDGIFILNQHTGVQDHNHLYQNYNAYFDIKNGFDSQLSRYGRVMILEIVLIVQLIVKNTETLEQIVWHAGCIKSFMKHWTCHVDIYQITNTHNDNIHNNIQNQSA